jgi:hypothetical protein
MSKRKTKIRRNIRKKNNRTKRYYRKGGNGENVKCCMCEMNIKKDNTLVPRECLMKYGKAAHRICQDCWWNSETGFARENVSHKCPGCKKNLPLTEFKKEAPIFVDLTED